MKKKRGLSLEEKRQIMLNLFRNDLSFFHYKDIEKHCVKNKINSMIVKELLEGLVGDDLVETEKIGSSSYYWSLPSRVLQAKQKTEERLKEQTKTLENDIENINKKIEENKQLRQDTAERKQKLEELDLLLQEINENEAIIKEFQKNDPERYDKLGKDIKTLNELYELWTDNIYIMSQWLRNKCNMDAKFEDVFPEVAELHLFD